MPKGIWVVDRWFTNSVIQLRIIVVFKRDFRYKWSVQWGFSLPNVGKRLNFLSSPSPYTFSFSSWKTLLPKYILHRWNVTIISKIYNMFLIQMCLQIRNLSLLAVQSDSEACHAGSAVVPNPDASRFW